ncbi:bombyxin B-2 homolog [Ostrinia furnacalis]|uniref:bombyxin B-2 homolog n=1 Tax=Ostrinia furnacalis TaxID=93504 RepID=UPI001040ADA8|nr:bombyxin B-2 homolog [Ostrinia furnacalis]
MKVLVFLFGLVCFSFVSSNTSSQFYCGRRLADTLAYLCPEDSVGKRSGMDTGDLDYWTWSYPRMALQGSRGKRGVVTECCEKACSLNELLSYC